MTLDSLAIAVTAEENRPVSFTNKDAAYVYTQTHRNDHPEHAWFRGLNVAGRRVFNDYTLRVDGAPLDPATSRAVVRPDALVRTYPNGATETIRLFDHHDVIEIALTGIPAASRAELRLAGDQLEPDSTGDGLAWYVSSTGGSAPIVDHVVVRRSGTRFLVAFGPTREVARAQLDSAMADAPRWEAERRARLQGLIAGERYLWTDDTRTTEALRWITVTTDELVTRQQGDGIYAGLPWFDQYWGRDSFISLPGATLVTGHFDEARAILTSFARFQDLDPSSPFYGRLPNIVQPGSIDYHTTDGTPRWVIALRDYVRYTGDRSIVSALYPNVRASIEGALAHWTDANGYLVHGDNETWMDARREPDHASYSPRATRANDIQALWHDQLAAGAGFAAMVGDTASAERWTRAAERVRTAFARDFVDARTGRVADHLDARDVADTTLRPNLLFALGLVPDERTAALAVRRAWSGVVFPWGVATLDPRDPFFHPYHVAWEHWHKDEAYHNGTVWPWLNGIAMQRMIGFGQTEAAWRLFRNMDELALTRGVVGGLPETMDAYPHPGEAQPRLTGAFLQAWSNAEQLRVWYQEILGIRPDLARGSIVLAPRLPDELGAVDASVRLGSGTLRAHYGRAPGARRYAWRIDGPAAALTVDIAPFETGAFTASPGDSLVAQIESDGVHVLLTSSSGAVKQTTVLAPSPARRERQAMLDSILSSATFAAPLPLESHPVMRQVYHRQ